MKKILLTVLFAFAVIPVYSYDKIATFELHPLIVIKNNKTSKDTGTIKQTYILNKNVISIIKSENKKINFISNKKDDLITTYNKTLDGNNYYLGYYRNSHSIVQIDENFENITLYNWNSITNKCTIWAGTAKN